MKELMRSMGQKAKAAARILANAPTEQKNRALTAAAKLMRAGVDELLEANHADMNALSAQTSAAMRGCC